MEIRPREAVILASDFKALIGWYHEVLGLTIVRLYEDDYHYCNLESSTGIKIGIADATEMGVEPDNRATNTVLLQFEVEDVKGCFAELETHGAKINLGPSYDEVGGFWYGGFQDPEGNPFWVVDSRCP